MRLFSRISTKNLFLLDAVGALVSAFFLGVVLSRFESVFGMPKSVLYFLALVPCVFALYSFCCYFFVENNHKPYMHGIALANLSYCCITAGLVFFHFESLTTLGLFYFLIEIVILGLLISAEKKAGKKYI